MANQNDTRSPETVARHDLARRIEDGHLSRAECMTVHGFYIVINCPECGEDITSGPNATAIEHKGLPVIPADIASQERFDCDDCGATVYTGDFYEDVESEPGGEDWNDEGDDD